MASPIALSAALSRMVAIACPYCHRKKLVSREPRQFRLCPHCHRRFADPSPGRHERAGADPRRRKP
jgi:ribosomal protein L37AE/L43A